MNDLQAARAYPSDDRTLAGEAPWAGAVVPPAHVVHTEYVPIHAVICLTRASQLYPAEVERAYRRQLELGDAQAWPPPTGYWRGDGRFVLTDGRNRYVAALMLGVEYLLVSSLVAPPEDALGATTASALTLAPAVRPSDVAGASSTGAANGSPFRCGCGGWALEVEGIWCCPIYLSPAVSCDVRCRACFDGGIDGYGRPCAECAAAG